MKHARADYDRIQDPAGLIGEDEPVFLIRAQDSLAPYVVQVWASLARVNGNDADIIAAAEGHVQLMKEWQRKHGVKMADLPHSPTPDGGSL